MKNSGNSEYRVVMHDFAKTLFKECVDSLASINMEEPDADTRFSDDIFNYSSALRLREKIDNATDEQNVELELRDWISVYTTLGVYCMVFSVKALSRFKNEVLAHPELGNEHDIEQLYERTPKARLLLHNLEKRLGHKSLFHQRQEIMIKRGWFKLMDPVPKYNILK
jgi:hypothetical protein